MTPMEIYVAFVLVFVTIFTFSILWKFKKMKEQRKALDAKFDALDEKLRTKKDWEGAEEMARAKLRMHPNYSNPRFDPKNPDVLLPRKKTAQQTQTVGNNSVGVQSGGSTTVVTDSSSDILASVALWSLMNHSHASSSSGNYDEDTGRVTTTTREEPSYTSSSSDDDDNRRSSYSSSYSSSSSDSSYSSSYDSSSSDSSYSSSYSSD